MARTRATVAAKVVTGKSSKARCGASSSSVSSVKSSRSYSGGNPVCPRETPKWQKPITKFFITKPSTLRESQSDGEEDSAEAGCSKSKPKSNIIYSDDEDQQPHVEVEEKQTDEKIDKPINKELDEPIELEPLTGEDSHKINEYYTSKTKGKGKKNSKEKIEKENIYNNVSRNNI